MEFGEGEEGKRKVEEEGGNVISFIYKSIFDFSCLILLLYK